MQKIQLAIPATKSEQLLGWLQDEEIIHITATSSIKKAGVKTKKTNTAYELAQVQFALEFIEQIRTELNIKKKKKLQNLFAGKPTATVAQLEQTLASMKLESLIHNITKRSETMADLKSLKTKIQDERVLHQPWLALNITGDQLIGTSSAKHLLVTINLPEELRLRKKLNDIPTAVWQEIERTVEKRKGSIYLEIIVAAKDWDLLNTALSKTNAEIVRLNLQRKENVAEHLTHLDKQLKQIEHSHQKILSSSKKYLRREREIKLAYDALLHRKEREDVSSNLLHLPGSIVITGWIPKKVQTNFHRELEEYFPSAALLNIEASKNEEPPVTFSNNRMMSPFEAVTNIYGKPKYSELDPSPALAIFFLIAFGMALSDAGYGIILMLATAFAQKYFKLKKEMLNMFRLLFYGGAATTVAGALTGGWFGINLEQLPDSLPKSILLTLKIVDPIASPMTLLLVAFALGIIQLLFAWGVKAFDLWRKGDIVGALFDGVAWIILVVSGLFWIAIKQDLLSAAFLIPSLVMIAISAAILVATQGRQHKNIIIRLGSGLISLYGLMSFVSDVLSYSRLLALGLATGIIGLVVNLIGGLVAGAIPGIGLIFAGVILVGGHLFNLGINTLGSFIHSGRLQYVEFFPKFLEGGGTPYQPLGRVGKYVDSPKQFSD